MKKIALIPARVESKRFHGKLLEKLSGIPIIIRTYQSAIETNVFDDVFVARAFKPLKVILQLIHSKAHNWKKIIIFLGKNGKDALLQASKNWDIKYKQRISVTSNDSFIIEVNKLIKK